MDKQELIEKRKELQKAINAIENAIFDIKHQIVDETINEGFCDRQTLAKKCTLESNLDEAYLALADFDWDNPKIQIFQRDAARAKKAAENEEFTQKFIAGDASVWQ